MRLIPVLTAIVVTVALYLAVFERDRLLSFAQGEIGAGELIGAGAAPETETETESGTESATGTGRAEDTTAAAAANMAADTAATPAQKTATGDGRKQVRVVAQRSQARPIDSAVVLRGQTRAARQVEVRAETSSTVISEPLRKGAFVTRGDVLCRLDPGTREAALAQARAALAEAQARVPEARARLEEARARLDEAEINWRAAEKLAKGGYAAETQLVARAAAMRAAEAGIESAKAGLESTTAGIEAAEANVAAAEREIDRLTILAPFDGLLESDSAELGSLMQPGSLCAVVIQLDPIKVVGYVPETEVNRIELGAQAVARLATGEEITGTVSFLSRSADPTTRTFEVEITVPNPDLKIRDGQTAEIVIAADGTQAHLLPQSALTLNNDGTLGVRVVAEGNRVGFIPVRLMRDTVNGVWVSGLPDAVDVIVVGQEFVTEGVPVVPSYREATQ